MDFLRKIFLPWSAAHCFGSREQFQQWLEKKRRLFDNLRIVFLALSALALLAGYILDRYTIMVLTIAPLSVVLLLSLALAKMEAPADGQNKSEPTTKE